MGHRLKTDKWEDNAESRNFISRAKGHRRKTRSEDGNGVEIALLEYWY